MDANLSSCAKCGHTVNLAAKACTYCGAVIPQEGQTQLIDENQDVVAPQSPAKAPPLKKEKTPAVEMPKTAAASAATSQKPSAETSDPIPSRETKPEKTDPAPKSAPAAKNDSVKPDEKVEFELSVEELIVEDKTAESQLEAEVLDPPETETAESLQPVPPSTQASAREKQPKATESDDEVTVSVDSGAEKPDDAQDTDAVFDELLELRESEIIEDSGGEPFESETLGAEILELVEEEDARMEPATASGVDRVKASDGPLPEEQADPAKTTEAMDAQNKADGSAASPESESSEDLMVLMLNEEVEPAEPDLPMQITESEKKSKPTTPADMSTGIEVPLEAEILMTSQASTKQKDAGASAESSGPGTAAEAMTEAVNKQKAASAKKAALQKQKAALARAEAIKKHKAARAKAELLKQQKLAKEKADALKRKKAAVARAQALKKQKDVQAQIETRQVEHAAATLPVAEERHRGLIQGSDSNGKMMGLLKKYEGQAIGINYDNTADIKEAELTEANNEFFRVFVKDQGLHYNYPLKTILTVIEGKDGVGAGGSDQKSKFNAVIKVYPLVLF